MSTKINPNNYRTHTCNQLCKNDVGKNVKLSGWVHRKRDHGNLLFVDLRDHYGITQLLFNADSSKDLLEQISKISNESVITVHGSVVMRAEGTANTDLTTGEIEVMVEQIYIESEAPSLLPLQVNSDVDYGEETRLRYRYLDLRRTKIHKNIELRSKVISAIRQKMTAAGFMEFQTPILTSSSPEGARDFLVPSRLHPGKFYALPQAPQIFKQLIMVAGFDRYFQIAPCFRDEDSRADRSPGEFYQLDIEMSFVTQDDVFAAIEPMLYEIFSEFSNKKVSKPFAKIAYKDAILKYGSDKPDLRNPIVISDVTDVFAGSEFSIFVQAIKKGARVRSIPAPQTSELPRSFFDKMIEFAKSVGAGGLAYIIFDSAGNAKGPIAKFLTEAQLSSIKESNGLGNGDSVFFACDTEITVAKIAGSVRNCLGNELNLINTSEFKLCWVVDFPFYELDQNTGKLEFSHNPFSMPQGGLKALENATTIEQKLEIKAFQYDIVCNGIELSSGAIRNHKPEIMYKAFEAVGYNKEYVDQKFAGLVNALKYGAPPHGGIAPGIDRILMLLADEPNIREVILFPMTQKAEDLMMSAPATVEDKQLKELHIKSTL